VGSAGRDWLPITCVKLAAHRSLGLHREAGATLQHSQQAPRAVGESVVPSQTSGQRGLVGYGVSITLWVAGARDLGAARGQLVFATAPFVGAIVAWTVFSDQITGR